MATADDSATREFIRADPEEKNIKYVGLDKLDIDSYMRLKLTESASRHYDKLKDLAHNDIELVVHIKESHKAGGTHQFAVNLRMTYPGATVPATKAQGWDALTALQDALDRLESNLTNNFKGNKKETPSIRKTGREMPGTDALPK